MRSSPSLKGFVSEVITADLGLLAKNGVDIDAEKLNSMASMFGMSIDLRAFGFAAVSRTKYYS